MLHYSPKVTIPLWVMKIKFEGRDIKLQDLNIKKIYIKIKGLMCTWHATLFLYDNNAFMSG